MKFYIKQKVFSFRDKFTVKDLEQNDLYQVKGKLMSISNKIDFMDMNEVVLLKAQKKILSILPKYFIYDKEEVLVAEVQKRFSFRPKFTVQALNNEMVVEGSLFGHNFSVMNNGELVAAISKKVFSFGDSYEIEIIPNENKELYLFLVIVIDQVIHESKKNGGSYNG